MDGSYGKGSGFDGKDTHIDIDPFCVGEKGASDSDTDSGGDPVG